MKAYKALWRYKTQRPCQLVSFFTMQVKEKPLDQLFLFMRPEHESPLVMLTLALVCSLSGPPKQDRSKDSKAFYVLPPPVCSLVPHGEWFLAICTRLGWCAYGHTGTLNDSATIPWHLPTAESGFFPSGLLSLSIRS